MNWNCIFVQNQIILIFAGVDTASLYWFTLGSVILRLHTVQQMSLSPILLMFTTLNTPTPSTTAAAAMPDLF